MLPEIGWELEWGNPTGHLCVCLCACVFYYTSITCQWESVSSSLIPLIWMSGGRQEVWAHMTVRGYNRECRSIIISLTLRLCWYRTPPCVCTDELYLRKSYLFKQAQCCYRVTGMHLVWLGQSPACWSADVQLLFESVSIQQMDSVAEVNPLE